MFEQIFGPVWIYSAGMFAAMALVVVWFSVKLTQGAGIYCIVAVIRLLQRFCLAGLAIVLLACALHVLEVRQNPPPIWLWMQIFFTASWVISAIRHLWAPDIPKDASWNNPILPTDVHVLRKPPAVARARRL